MQTSLKRLGFQFSTRKDMSAKFPRGGANPFSAIRLFEVATSNGLEGDTFTRNVTDGRRLWYEKKKKKRV